MGADILYIDTDNPAVNLLRAPVPQPVAEG